MSTAWHTIRILGAGLHVSRPRNRVAFLVKAGGKVRNGGSPVVLTTADAVPLDVAVGVVVCNFVHVAVQAFGDGLEAVLSDGAVHGARELARVADLRNVQVARMPRHIHALENRAHCACERIIAGTYALGTHTIVAPVDALADVLATLGLCRGRIVQDQLAEEVRAAVWSVYAGPLLSKSKHKNSVVSFVH